VIAKLVFIWKDNKKNICSYNNKNLSFAKKLFPSFSDKGQMSGYLTPTPTSIPIVPGRKGNLYCTAQVSLAR
jgi:hypothetical protein